MRAPVSRASSMSRWTISSSASAGQPGSPSSLQQRALVHHRPGRQAGDLAVLGEHHVEAERVLHRPAHQQRVLHAVAVVGEDPHAGVDQLGVRGERLARPAHRDAAGRQHLAQPGLAALGADELDDAPRVLGRVGVRHRHDGREPAEGGGPAAGLDRLGLLPPGSRRWTWRSTKPGATTHPPASRTSSPSPTSPPDGGDAPALDQHVGAPLPVLVDDRAAADQPRVTSTHLHVAARAEQLEQHGHPHGDAVGDLLGDHGPGQLGRVDEDLDAPVHRAGVHHEGVVGQPAGPLGRQPEAGAVLAQARHERLVHPLSLHPQQVQHVDLLDHRVEVVRGRRRRHRRQQRGRGDERDVGAEQREDLDVAAGHPAVADVADDGDPQRRRARRCGRAPRARCRRRAGPGSGGRASRRRR